MKRHPTPELLDTDSGTPAEVAAALRDLQWFNQRFGGIATSRAQIEAVVHRSGARDLSLLEVAAGSGFVPLRLQADMRSSGISLNVILLDRVLTHLPKNGTVPKLAADALQLPLADASQDFVSCSLFAHHLSPDELVQFGREALRVCRLAVLINDLVRNPFHLAIAYAGIPFYRSRLTRNDAPASVKQAYTVEEMRNLLERSGASEVDVQRHYFYRMGVIAWK